MGNYPFGMGFRFRAGSDTRTVSGIVASGMAIYLSRIVSGNSAQNVAGEAHCKSRAEDVGGSA
jgi:hypothetical protein